MTSPTRLGDLLRVVHALQPDADQVGLIGELLPGDRGAAAGAARSPTRARASEPGGSAEGSPASRTPPSLRGRRSRTKGRARRMGGRRGFLPEPGPRERAWWTAVAVLVALVLLLQAVGRLGVSAWPLIVVLVAARPLWWCAQLGWSAWWCSPQHLSSVDEYETDDGPDDDDAGAIGVALRHVRWQEPPPGQPLVRAGQQRAVATLLAGRPMPGEIDVVETVRRMASRRPLTKVPHRRRWSTNQGMQLHVDMGPALEPFRYDVDHLHRALVAIASPHGVVEVGFDGDPRVITWPPRLVGHGGRLDLADRLPAPDTPVLVVTDLGIAVPQSGSPPEPEVFLDHHRLLGQAGCSVHYLVPYPPARWPPRLRALPILYWSDDLGPGEVLAGIRRRARPG